jgi:penicillin-binding protein 1A
MSDDDGSPDQSPPAPGDGDADPSETPAATAAPTLAGRLAAFRSRAAPTWRWLRWPVYAFVAFVLLLAVAGAWLWSTTDLPPARSTSGAAVLLDREGNELALLAQEGLRLEVPLEEMAPVAIDALIAAEDQRFYDHTGIDPVGIARALWNNLTDDSLQGGSTLTQQLVKNAYLNSERTFSRKVREAVLAVKLERTEDKDQILERYLNTVYFGRGAYGLEAAARTYFDSRAADLSPERAALLMGLLRSPERLDPGEDLEASQRRRDAVLASMVEMGTLTPEEGEAAIATPIEVTVRAAATTTLQEGVAPHFVEHVRGLLIEEFGEQALYDEGLVVHTTLDLTDQRAAEAAVAANLDDSTDPQAAVVAVDRTGAVRAWVGGRDFETLQVDLAGGAGGSGRQPGSTFKPVTLAANFEAGNGAGEQYPAPAEITLDVAGGPWTVSNADGQDYGVISLADATVNSVNTVYAQALTKVGPKAVAELGERLGITSELEPEPSIALGTEEVSPLEMASLYSTFARSGVRIDPFVLTKVEDAAGATLFEVDEPEEEEAAIEPRIADTVSAVLAETPRRGTARRSALDRPMAAKTGTTQRNADAWLAGYTPEYTAVVWVGNPDSNEPIPPVDGQVVQGGTIPAMIWHDFMVEALADVPPTEFPPPDPELLSDTSPPMELTATPRVDAGQAVDIVADGYQLCQAAWFIVLEGPTSVAEQPGGGQQPPVTPVLVESPPDVGSDESTRRTSVQMPTTAVPGAYQVSARCDAGAGPQSLGPTATVEVRPDPSATTTTSSTTTSTTTTTEKPRDTTTTTAPDGTTTTEAPPGRDEGDG